MEAFIIPSRENRVDNDDDEDGDDITVFSHCRNILIQTNCLIDINTLTKKESNRNCTMGRSYSENR